jgi:hypothetical protein
MSVIPERCNGTEADRCSGCRRYARYNHTQDWQSWVCRFCPHYNPAWSQVRDRRGR